jgi:hypothetical protein
MQIDRAGLPLTEEHSSMPEWERRRKRPCGSRLKKKTKKGHTDTTRIIKMALGASKLLATKTKNKHSKLTMGLMV